jgi:Zn-dependent protease
MAIDAQLFRFSSVGIIVTILTGFVGLLATGILFSKLILLALTTLPFTVGLATAAFLRHASSLTIWFALFSLIPIPPLTGGLLVSIIGIRIPKYTQWILTTMVLVAVATGVVDQLLNPAYLALTSLILDK